MIRLLIIDGLNMLRRIYSALPAERDTAPDPQRYLNICERAFDQALNRHQPSHAVCVVEHYANTWRHALYPPYKANRKPQPQGMLASFPELRDKLARRNIGWLDINGYEADDIIASIVRTTELHDCCNLILSTDHLMAQLIDDRIHLFDHFNQRPIDQEIIFKRYGIHPWQLPDYFALTGSSSVNVPGIAGIGPKTARSLLEEYGNIEALIRAPALPPKIAAKLAGADHTLYLFRALFTLRSDCPIDGNLKDWRL